MREATRLKRTVTEEARERKGEWAGNMLWHCIMGNVGSSIFWESVYLVNPKHTLAPNVLKCKINPLMCFKRARTWSYTVTQYISADSIHAGCFQMYTHIVSTLWYIKHTLTHLSTHTHTLSGPAGCSLSVITSLCPDPKEISLNVKLKTNSHFR